jgi:hypothetical protein
VLPREEQQEQGLYRDFEVHPCKIASKRDPAGEERISLITQLNPPPFRFL